MSGAVLCQRRIVDLDFVWITVILVGIDDAGKLILRFDRTIGRRGINYVLVDLRRSNVGAVANFYCVEIVSLVAASAPASVFSVGSAFG